MAMRKMEDMLDNLISMCEDCRKDANKFDRLGTIAAGIRLRQKLSKMRMFARVIRKNVQEVKQARRYIQEEYDAIGTEIEDVEKTMV